MDGTTLHQIRDVLLARRRRVGGDRQRVMEPADIDAVGQSAEIIDIAQSLEQIDRDSSLAEQERRELLAIERALAKMASGTFGTCEECDEEITPRRLLVLPEARLCARCQAFEERQQGRTRGGPRGAVA